MLSRTIFLAIIVLLAIIGGTSSKEKGAEVEGEDPVEELKNEADKVVNEAAKEMDIEGGSTSDKIKQMYKFFLDNLFEFLNLVKKWIESTGENVPKYWDQAIEWSKKLFETLKAKLGSQQ
ncbi:uncharacterized protein LOC141850775 [Brevipalpus obovatus]|uniref:uncharacterized protein LOC141850775 n=1 Tax=Brevipalpus obovatus TaxID=246614 RepID=UPI003D9EA21A